MLPYNDFKNVVEKSALCAIDLIIKNETQEVLLGFRKNKPAKGFWFVPGGRIFKNETLKDALKRISNNEIGLEVNQDDVRLIGLYEHIYEENFFEERGFNTHYIIIACEFICHDYKNILPSSQHEKYRFMSIEDILASNDVHIFTKNYFIDSPDNLFIKRDDEN